MISRTLKDTYSAKSDDKECGLCKMNRPTVVKSVGKFPLGGNMQHLEADSGLSQTACDLDCDAQFQSVEDVPSP